MTTSGFYNWSQTAATNATADGTINWAEGQAPSSVNDSARAVMARLREWGNDIAGTITTSGTATAYTVASNQVFTSLALLSGQVIGFVPHATNTNTVGNDVTLNVDSLGAKPIRMQPSVPLPTGALILGTPYIVVYNNSDAVFYLQGMTNPYVVPLASGFDYWGSSTPNSSFAFPAGQAISRTTYASLFSIMGTTYGTGDGSTTFNLPDKTGRVSAMKEASASRLTSTYFGGNSANLGAVGGSESHTLIAAEIPSITSTGTTNFGGTVPIQTGGGAYGNANGPNSPATLSIMTVSNTMSAISSAPASVGSTNTSGNAHAITQPTIICNYIIRVI